MAEGIADRVERALARQPVTDMHTHCYAPAFGHSGDGSGPSGEGGLLRWGIDELLNYHYLVVELFRVVPADELAPERFFAMPRADRADLIWDRLFVGRAPVSEACIGVVTTLTALGLDPSERTLSRYRDWFARQHIDAHIDRVMELAGVDHITMTNSPFCGLERALWQSAPGIRRDPRFSPVLRIDPLLEDWPAAAASLRQWGYEAGLDPTPRTVDAVRRFLTDWIDRMDPAYVATSLGPDFRFPDPDDPVPTVMIERALIPVLRERGMAWALMIGAERGVNPGLREGGDGVGRADTGAIAELCRSFPDCRFLVTMLSRENQHELCVEARKFANLMPFGCWWFLNTPTFITELTRMRLELLGATFIAQHSDARVLEQLIYKWWHSRKAIAGALAARYEALAHAGRAPGEDDIRRDVGLLLRDNYHSFVGLPV